MGVVDTIEPLKTYRDSGLTDKYILTNLLIDFKKDSIMVKCNEGSDLDFSKLVKKLEYFEGWLDIGIRTEKGSFELTFN